MPPIFLPNLAMKTFGERLRQAREYRHMTAERLALLVGYKSASAILNLEARNSGRGGYKTHLLAKELDVDENWLLNGPDTDDMSSVPPYKNAQTHHVAESVDENIYLRGLCNDIIASLNKESLDKALDYLRMLRKLQTCEAQRPDTNQSTATSRETPWQ